MKARVACEYENDRDPYVRHREKLIKVVTFGKLN